MIVTTSTAEEHKLTAKQHSSIFNYVGIEDHVFSKHGDGLILYRNDATGELQIGDGLFAVGGRVGELLERSETIFVDRNDYFFVVASWDGNQDVPICLNVIVSQNPEIALNKDDIQRDPNGKRDYVIYKGRRMNTGIFDVMEKNINNTLNERVNLFGNNLLSMEKNLLEMENFVNQMEDTGWINASLNSGWSSQYSTAPARYRKIGKLVMIEAFVSATAAAGGTMFTLPAEFRSSTVYKRLTVSEGSASSNLNTRVISIFPDGRIEVLGKGTSSLTWLAISHMFLID